MSGGPIQKDAPESATYKKGCVKYVDPKYARRRDTDTLEKDSWKKCDAVRYRNRLCNQWEVVSLEEFQNPDRKFMCEDCIKNNRSFKA